MAPSDRPRILIPPPLVYLGGFGLVLALRWAWPVPILDHPAVTWAGVALLGPGILLNAWGTYSLIRARTPINPYRPTVRRYL